MFKNEYLSVSRLKRFEQCPQAFFFQYVEPGPKAPLGEAPAFGILLHEVLEALYGWIVSEEFQGRIPEDKLLELYRDGWQRTGLSGLALYQEGSTILRNYLHQNPEADHMAILAIEQPIDIPLHAVGEPEPAFRLNGYIDRVDKTGPDEITIVDYKSNRLLFSREEVDCDLQMSAYGLAARVLYPWAKTIRFVFHMLRHGVKQETSRTPAELDTAQEYLIALGRKSEQGKYPAKLNTNCGYCDHRLRCTDYRNALDGKLEIVKHANAEDLEAVAQERETCARVAKMAYARKEELDRILKAKLADTDLLCAAGMAYRMMSFTTTEYPLRKTLQAFTAAGVDPQLVEDRILRVDSKAVETLVKELADEQGLDRAKRLMLKTRIESLEIKKPMAPRLDARAVKTKEASDAKPPKSRAKKAQDATQ